MHSARSPHDVAIDEQAGLYVLEMLAPAERCEFERRLAADPTLRALVRDLQGNLDALVLAEPSRPAPLRVWGRIAAEVKSAQAPVIGFPISSRQWLKNVLAAAACIAIGFLLHLGWSSRTGSGIGVAADTEPAPGNPMARPRENPNATVLVPAPALPPVAAADPDPAARTAAAKAEAARLRERVRSLAAQVAALNQVLNQKTSPPGEVSLPSGVTRLHVFQLVNTNANPESGIFNGHLATPALPDLLARLAAGPPGSSSVNTLNPTGSNDASLNTGTPDAALLTSIPTAGLQLNGGQPIGFFDPDSGRGAIALSDGITDADHRSVAWLQTTGVDGTATFQNLGVQESSGADNIIVFNLSTPGEPASLHFLVTIEPADAASTASTPTGPVVGTTPAPRP